MVRFKQSYVLYMDYKQLFDLSIHLGHTIFNSEFYALWSIKGKTKEKLLYDMGSHLYYILNMKGTRLGLITVTYVAEKGGGLRSVWYICHDPKYMQTVARYGLLMGEVVSCTHGIGGCITNYRSVMLFLYMILVYVKAGFKLNIKHKKRILSLLGLSFMKVNLPFFLFLIKFLSLPIAAAEGIRARTMSTGLVDSDMRGGVKIPIISNDDSLISVNFYLYFFSKKIFLGKVLKIFKGRKVVRNTSTRKSIFILGFYLYFFSSLNQINNETKEYKAFYSFVYNFLYTLLPKLRMMNGNYNLYDAFNGMKTKNFNYDLYYSFDTKLDEKTKYIINFEFKEVGEKESFNFEDETKMNRKEAYNYFDHFGKGWDSVNKYQKYHGGVPDNPESNISF